MRIILHKNFRKHYRALRTGEKRKFKERRDIFLKDPFHPLLNNHALHGEYAGFRSINITGDLRILYELVEGNIVHFITIGSHSNLFS